VLAAHTQRAVTAANAKRPLEECIRDIEENIVRQCQNLLKKNAAEKRRKDLGAA
jgi:hypothetical protein